MGTTSPKAVIMDETAVNRAMTRIAHEILERNEGCEDSRARFFHVHFLVTVWKMPDVGLLNAECPQFSRKVPV